MSNEHDITLTFEQLVTACGGETQTTWVESLIAEDIITISGDVIHSTYTGSQMARIRKAQRLRRDFDASVPAVALILELLDELEGYRKRLS